MESNFTSEMSFVQIQKVLTYLFGSISCFMSLIILIIFIISRNKLFEFELIFYLTLSSMISNISYFINFVESEDNMNQSLCKVQSFLQISSETSIIIFATFISIFCYISIKNYYLIDYIETKIKTARIIVLLLGFGIPIVATIFLEIFNVVGVTEIWCWLDGKSIKIQFIYLISVWVLLIVNIIFSCMSFHESQMREIDSLNKINYAKKLWLYPIICYITWFVATLDRITYFYIKDKVEFTNFVIILDIVVFQLQGLGYCSIFLYSNKTKVKEVLRNIIHNKCNFCLCCKCCFKEEDSNVNLSNFIEKNSDDSFDYENLENNLSRNNSKNSSKQRQTNLEKSNDELNEENKSRNSYEDKHDNNNNNDKFDAINTLKDHSLI